MYDSTEDTLAHIVAVRDLLDEVIGNLVARSTMHDLSKLAEPEKAMYDEFTPKLREMTYGSPEYKQALADMGPALAHHYDHNSHHPEHHVNGIEGMSLLDLIEMLADWTASISRSPDGDLYRSIEINQTRFEYTDELATILRSTAREMGWVKTSDVGRA
jgi:hypothetical protein